MVMAYLALVDLLVDLQFQGQVIQEIREWLQMAR